MTVVEQPTLFGTVKCPFEGCEGDAVLETKPVRYPLARCTQCGRVSISREPTDAPF